MKYENYYLDLEKVYSLKDDYNRELIHNYYSDMLSHFSNGRTKIATSIFYTLSQGGFLKEMRNDDIEKIFS